MKIIIIGAGQTGSDLAEYLVTENKNDITVIDIDPTRLKTLQDRFDLQVIEGPGSYPDILAHAGAESADIVVAVTHSDEVNILACYICEQLFHVPKKVARLLSSNYINEDYSLFSAPEHLMIDRIIAPQQIITQNIKNLITYNGALQIESFCSDQLYLVSAIAYYGGSLVGSELSELHEHLPYADVKIVAIYRKERFIRPLQSTLIEAGDLIYFMTIKSNIKAIMNELQRLEKPCKRIMINGGDHIAVSLAKQLERTYQVKLIESDTKKAELIADQLIHTVVLNSDASDQEFLSQEQIELIDVFISLTDDDEANIMSSMLAKRMGAKKVMILVERRSYLELITESSIDIALSPQQATISELLAYVRGSNMIKLVPLKGKQAQVIEIALIDPNGAHRLSGKSIESIKLPNAVNVISLVRNGEAMILEDAKITLQDKDHLILFVPNRKLLSDVESLLN